MEKRKVMLFACMTVLLFGIVRAECETGARGIAVRDGSGVEVGLYRESHALVIGVSDYDNGWPKLPGVREDIEAVSSCLSENGFRVETVTDPDSRELVRSFKRFIGAHGGKTENRLLFYFAGHGHTIAPKWGGQPMGYIVPKEAPNPNMDESGFKDVALPMQRIEEYALGIDAKHAIFIFDSCFSGSLFAVTRAIPENISYKTARPVRQFITAGAAEEAVPDVSVFRRQFVAALGGEGDLNRDGYVTGAELGEFLQNTVVNYSRGGQHPQYGKIRNPHLDKGDFVFPINSANESSAVDLPGKPAVSDFTLDDLEERARREKEVRRAWRQNLLDMKSAYEKVRSYEQRDASSSLKASAWRRFIEAYGQENPYSEEDGDLRRAAEKRVEFWENEKLTAATGHSGLTGTWRFKKGKERQDYFDVDFAEVGARIVSRNFRLHNGGFTDFKITDVAYNNRVLTIHYMFTDGGCENRKGEFTLKSDPETAFFEGTVTGCGWSDNYPIVAYRQK